MNPFEVLDKLVRSKLEVTDRIEYELNLLQDAPRSIVDAFLAAYQHIVIGGNDPKPINECHSMIAYKLGITTMDPGKTSFHYPVEPGSLPDIDSDFGDRDAVKEYLVNKYGRDKIVSISTYGRYKFKALLGDLARVIKDEDGNPIVDKKEVFALTKKLDSKIDTRVHVRKDQEFEEEEEEEEVEFDHPLIIDFAKKYPEIFQHFSGLYGNVKYRGRHAGGVVLFPEAATNFLPLALKGGELCTEWIEGQGVAELGAVGAIKMDILGLTTLPVLDTANRLIMKRYQIDENSPSPCDCKAQGKTCETDYKMPMIERIEPDGSTIKLIDLDRLCLNISSVYKSLCKGKTQGVFQLEPKGITDFTKQFKPERFEDLPLISALFRPGAMGAHLDEDGMPIDPDDERYDKFPGSHMCYVMRKNGEQKVTYSAPVLKDLLGSQFGIAVYQEDISRIIMVMTGCEFAKAEKTRKFLTKVKPELLKTDPDTIAAVNGYRDTFIAGCLKQGHSEKTAHAVWNVIIPFARYGFVKAHATTYALLSYQTAFFRTAFPLEFFTAMLIINNDGTGNNKDEKALEYIRTAQSEGFIVRPPDINTSMANFSINDKDEIVAGLSVLKGVGAKAAQTLVTERETNGKFQSVQDMLGRKVNWRSCTLTALKPIAMAGALDSIEPNRALAMARILVAKGKAKKSDFQKVEVDMFSEEGETTTSTDIWTEDWSDGQKRALELECIGFEFEDEITRNLDAVKAYYKTMERVAVSHRTSCTAGRIEEMKVFADKRGNNMAFARITTLTGEKERWVFFSKTFAVLQRRLKNKEFYFAFGKRDRDDSETVLVDAIQSYSECKEQIFA